MLLRFELQFQAAQVVVLWVGPAGSTQPVLRIINLSLGAAEPIFSPLQTPERHFNAVFTVSITVVLSSLDKLLVDLDQSLCKLE